MQMPYAKMLADVVESKEYEREHLAKGGKVDPESELVKEVKISLEVTGLVSLKRLRQELSVTPAVFNKLIRYMRTKKIIKTKRSGKTGQVFVELR